MAIAYILSISDYPGIGFRFDARAYMFGDEPEDTKYVGVRTGGQFEAYKAKWAFADMEESYGTKYRAANIHNGKFNCLEANSRWRRVSKCVFFRFLKTQGITKAQFLEKASS